ncbi:hypothetical protein L3Y34_018736 [Caenorhabditis briggsae]|uniref:Uncharacterized protein n=1 Tax=Caenorhabditis briggsae TaxID=6238 RepID=A0AAE9DM97_CAEBR|nr:hypothetical protein L3Y34_018736 [Caenorhabditis briggsae]
MYLKVNSKDLLGDDDDREQVKKQQGQVGGFREECSEDGDDGKLDRSDAESGKMDERASRIRGKSGSNKKRKGGVGREA